MAWALPTGIFRTPLISFSPINICFKTKCCFSGGALIRLSLFFLCFWGNTYEWSYIPNNFPSRQINSRYLNASIFSSFGLPFPLNPRKSKYLLSFFSELCNLVPSKKLELIKTLLRNFSIASNRKSSSGLNTEWNSLKSTEVGAVDSRWNLIQWHNKVCKGAWY